MSTLLKHLNQCPKCEHLVSMKVKIHDIMIKDAEDKDEPGTLYFACSGPTSHQFKLTPAGKLVRLADIVVKAPRKKAVKAEKKKETKQIRKIKVVKKAKKK